MILIRTDWPSFEEYVASLSKPARKNYKAAMKAHESPDDVPIRNYAIWNFSKGGGFPTDDVRQFMSLWERQLIRGKTVQWAFPVETVKGWADAGDLMLFQAVDNNHESIGMQFIQKRDGYWECHPPMYDKTKHPWLAKYMWFSLIRYAIEHKLAPLDMGGGSDDWEFNLKNRIDFPNTKYKWMYVPEKTKRDPDSEPRYYIGKPVCKLLLRN
jgi:hypothetical protein